MDNAPLSELPFYLKSVLLEKNYSGIQVKSTKSNSQKTARFEFFSTPLAGLKVILRNPTDDNRGFFSRMYCASEFVFAGSHKPIVQINHSFTKNKGTVRGMHFQYPPHEETKVINCVQGSVFDVAVDIRRNSPTFLNWYVEILSSNNMKSLFIPEGFAHGFQTLTDDCILIYLHTASYAPEYEGRMNVSDPRLSISWPLQISELSDRDLNCPYIDDQIASIIH
jgi:dTDP-4-dehydrorhamnose 3,5-epimerase